MDGKMLARLAAVVFVAFALTATAIEMTREEEPDMRAPSAVQAAGSQSNAVRAELTRCQQLGEVAIGDQSCLRAWADNRRRFLGVDTEPVDRPSDASVMPATEAR